MSGPGSTGRSAGHPEETIIGSDRWMCRGDDVTRGVNGYGDGIPGLVGWEWMGAPAKIPGLEVVARGRVAYARVEREYTATLYPGPKDNVVFNAATIWWADGLSAPPGYATPS